MPPRDVVSHHLDELTARMEELERRVSALEHPAREEPFGRKSPAAQTAVHLHASVSATGAARPSIFSIFGRVVLGIAGAYVLRAAAESGIIPAWLAVAAAIVYAAAWLGWSAWARSQDRVVRYSYAVTAGLILAPLLWEATVRFHILAPWVAAGVLAAFAGLALILALRADASGVSWVGMFTATVTALILLVATRALTPFTLALLVMAALGEVAILRGRWKALRPFVAVAADAAVPVLIIILGNPRSVPVAYQVASAGEIIAIGVALFAIYAASVVFRSLILNVKMGVFDTAQFAVAAMLAGWSVIRATAGAGVVALGICCFIAAGVCYFVAFTLLAPPRERPNFHCYATFALVFALAGSFFALPFRPLVISLCVAALAATGLGVRIRSAVLDLHGVVYLSGAAYASGLLAYAGHALAGASPPSALGAMPMIAVLAALLCTATISRYPGEHFAERLMRLLPAILALYAIAALAVAALIWLIAHGATLALPRLAVIRTTVTCVAALCLAFGGARWKRVELVWMAYAAAVLGCLKLIFEDLRIGSTQSLAASLLIYGAVLILIPPVVRAGRRWA